MEVGGPSRIFSDGALLPIYPLARAIDNFNIASCAVEDEQEDHTTVPDPGSLMLVNKVIEDGAVLDEVPDATYEFAASSHALEHFANPIKALVEWKRTLGSGGALLLCVPHKDGTFDHRRPTTEFSHIVEDFRSDMGQDDMTHMREAIDMADLSKAPWITREEYVEKCSRNPEFRYIHHHAFVTETVVRMVDHGGFRIVRVFTHRPHQIVLLAEKTVEPEEHVHQLNARFIEAGASWRRRSPFPSDRR
jgi:SAM-dependent methyltransferase